MPIPPYTDAQYSRYYHVLETLVTYSYPAISNVGRYPDGRFQTPFSHASKVKESMDQFVRLCSELGSTLVFELSGKWALLPG